MKYVVTLALCCFLMLTGCAEDSQRLPTQTWENLFVTMETRPPTAQRGMNEFLVIANEEQVRAASDLIVTLVVKGKEKRYQAIQDGHVGVYRRAIPLEDPANDVIIVEIQRGEETGYLEFHMSEQRPAKKN